MEQVHNPVHRGNQFTLDSFSFLTASELLAETYEPLVFLYEEIIPTPNLVLLAGPPKIGKSWYAMHIMQEVRKNGHRVVLLANEDSNRRLQNRYKKILPFEDNGVFFFGGLSNQTAIPKGKMAHDFIRAIAAKYEPKMIIIDTVQAIRSADKKEDYASVEEEFLALRHLAHERDIVVICVHHAKKVPDYAITPIDSILGLQGIAATVETILVMQEMSNTKDANLFITGKDVEPAKLVLHWCYPGYSDPELAILASLGSTQVEVLDFIRSNPRCTQSAIVNKINKLKAKFWKLSVS